MYICVDVCVFVYMCVCVSNSCVHAFMWMGGCGMCYLYTILLLSKDSITSMYSEVGLPSSQRTTQKVFIEDTYTCMMLYACTSANAGCIVCVIY